MARSWSASRPPRARAALSQLAWTVAESSVAAWRPTGMTPWPACWLSWPGISAAPPPWHEVRTSSAVRRLAADRCPAARHCPAALRSRHHRRLRANRPSDLRWQQIQRRGFASALYLADCPSVLFCLLQRDLDAARPTADQVIEHGAKGREGSREDDPGGADHHRELEDGLGGEPARRRASWRVLGGRGE